MRNLLVTILSACLLTSAVAAQPTEPDEVLEKLLRSARQKDDVDARVQAIMGLAEFGPKAAPALPDLLDALQTKNEDLRLNAAITLAKIGKPAIEPVAKLLKSDDTDTQFYAVWTIGWIGPEAKELTPTIIKLMSAKNEGVRRKAAFALGRLVGDPDKTMDVLLKALKDESPEVRQAAGDALAKLGKIAVPPLIALLKSDDIEAQMQASIALGEIGSDAQDAVPILKDKLLANGRPGPNHCAQILAKLGKTAVPALAAGLKHSQPDVRNSAAQALQQMGAEAVGALIDALGDKNVEVRRLAAQTLWPMRIGDKSVVVALAFGLADEDEQVRVWCMNGLQQLGPQAKPGSAKIKDALTDMNPNIRQGAYFLLQQIGDDPRPTLTKALKSKNDKVRINTASLMVSVNLDTNVAAPILEAALKHEDLGLKMQAAFTLAQRQLNKDQVLPIFVDGLNHKTASVRLQAVQGLHTFGPGAGHNAPLLAKMLADADPQVRQTSVYALQHVRGKPEEVIPVLAKTYKDGNPETRRAVLQTVYGYADKGMDIVIDGLKDKDLSVRQQAIYSLQNVRGAPDKMIPILTGVFKDSDAGTRRSIMQIAYIYGEKAVDLVLTGVKDKDDSVRQQAIWSLHNVRVAPEKIMPVLTSTYKDGDGNIRRAVLQICHIYGDNAKPLVVDGLKDKEASVRQQAVYALHNIQGDLSELLPALIALVEDKDLAGHRQQTVWLLSRTGEAGAPYLGQLLKDKDVNVRTQAAQFLRNLGPKAAKALPAIKEAINDPAIRANCMYLVAAAGGDGPDFLVKQFGVAKDAGSRAMMLQALVQANQKKIAAPLLKTAMQDESTHVRQATVVLLGNFGQDSPEAFEAFKMALKDADPDVWRNAALLGSFYGKKCHEPLEEALKGTKNSNFRQNILQSLVNSDYRAKSGLMPIIDCLSDKNAGSRQHACSLLARLGPDAAAALPMLRKLAGDTTNPDVQREAQNAVKRIESRE